MRDSTGSQTSIVRYFGLHLCGHDASLETNLIHYNLDTEEWKDNDKKVRHAKSRLPICGWRNGERQVHLI